MKYDKNQRFFQKEKKMGAKVKNQKCSVLCKCGKTIKITVEKIHYRQDRYSTDTAIKEKVKVDRFWVVCPKCDDHPNVAGIVSEEMKNEAKTRR
ncbi:MAG: hypothetical protein WCT49_03495 [Candidatus Paceibacterota bacterium]|jgi:hypothetical protein|nr:hypothetical protein [Candidatus Paceibacterota bacterium]